MILDLDDPGNHAAAYLFLHFSFVKKEEMCLMRSCVWESFWIRIARIPVKIVTREAGVVMEL